MAHRDEDDDIMDGNPEISYCPDIDEGTVSSHRLLQTRDVTGRDGKPGDMMSSKYIKSRRNLITLTYSKALLAK